MMLESQRLLYNAALEERIGAYRQGISRSYMDQTKALTDAYRAFFRRVKDKNGKAGFPRYRGKGWWDSFGFREFEGISFDDRRLRFKGVPGRLKVHAHRPLPEDVRVRSCTFRRDTKGWKLGFAVELPVTAPRRGNRTVGVDLGISTFAAMSDGGFVPSLRAARRAERKLRLAQRSLSRKRCRSKAWYKARREIARRHAATAQARSNHLHHASARLVRDYDVIAVEKLHVKRLARSALARDIHDASWAKFLSILRYKAEKAGARLIEVDCRYSSQECSGCGMMVPKLLNERWHVCRRCGLSIDRDLNAARNILHRAGVGPGLPNEAAYGKRAGGNFPLTDHTASCRWSGKLKHYP